MEAKAKGQILLDGFMVMELTGNHKCSCVFGIFLYVKYGGVKIRKKFRLLLSEELCIC